MEARDALEARSVTAPTENKPILNADAPYRIDAEKLEEFLKSGAHQREMKYFKNAKMSPSAAMKMMMHVQSGVNRRSALGKPTEVMGLLFGHPCTDDTHTMIISDAQALPVEGIETAVVANTDECMNYIIDWRDMLSKTKHPDDILCGWYVLKRVCFQSNTYHENHRVQYFLTIANIFFSFRGVNLLLTRKCRTFAVNTFAPGTTLTPSMSTKTCRIATFPPQT
jgi:hypothetical protein